MDLDPLAGMALERLEMGQARVASLRPLRGMPLRTLSVAAPEDGDWSSLADTAIETLHLTCSDRTDLAARGLKVRKLVLVYPFRLPPDAALADWPDLERIDQLPQGRPALLASLARLPKLKTVNGLPLAEFLK